MRRYLPSLFICLRISSCRFMHWYIRVSAVKYLLLCLIPGRCFSNNSCII